MTTITRDRHRVSSYDASKAVKASAEGERYYEESVVVEEIIAVDGLSDVHYYVPITREAYKALLEGDDE